MHHKVASSRIWKLIGPGYTFYAKHQDIIKQQALKLMNNNKIS